MLRACTLSLLVGSALSLRDLASKSTTVVHSSDFDTSGFMDEVGSGEEAVLDFLRDGNDRLIYDKQGMVGSDADGGDYADADAEFGDFSLSYKYLDEQEGYIDDDADFGVNSFNLLVGDMVGEGGVQGLNEDKPVLDEIVEDELVSKILETMRREQADSKHLRGGYFVQLPEGGGQEYSYGFALPDDVLHSLQDSQSGLGGHPSLTIQSETFISVFYDIQSRTGGVFIDWLTLLCLLCLGGAVTLAFMRSYNELHRSLLHFQDRSRDHQQAMASYLANGGGKATWEPLENGCDNRIPAHTCSPPRDQYWRACVTTYDTQNMTESS